MPIDIKHGLVSEQYDKHCSEFLAGSKRLVYRLADDCLPHQLRAPKLLSVWLTNTQNIDSVGEFI